VRERASEWDAGNQPAKSRVVWFLPVFQGIIGQRRKQGVSRGKGGFHGEKPTKTSLTSSLPEILSAAEWAANSFSSSPFPPGSPSLLPLDQVVEGRRTKKSTIIGFPMLFLIIVKPYLHPRPFPRLSFEDTRKDGGIQLIHIIVIKVISPDKGSAIFREGPKLSPGIEKTER